MSDIFSRRKALLRLGALAAVAYATPVLMTITKAQAKDGGDGASGGHGSGNSGHGSENSGHGSENSGSPDGPSVDTPSPADDAADAPSPCDEASDTGCAAQ